MSPLHQVRTIEVLVNIGQEIVKILMQMLGFLEEDLSRHLLQFLGMLGHREDLRVPILARNREPGMVTLKLRRILAKILVRKAHRAKL